MAYSPSEKYPGAVDSDPNYKGGKFRDNNPSTTNNGSPLKAIDRNELLARDEAIMNDAGFEYSGVADTPQDSQLFKAYKASLGNGANLLSNHNFINQRQNHTQPAPSATPTSYPPGYQIFSSVFANETTGITNMTYIDGRVSFSGGDLYFSVPNTGGIEHITEFVASVADFDGKPRTRGVSFALVGDEYRVTVGVDALEDVAANPTPLGSVKFEQGVVATGHDVVEPLTAKTVGGLTNYQASSDDINAGKFKLGDIVVVTDRGNKPFLIKVGTDNGMDKINAGSGNIAEYQSFGGPISAIAVGVKADNLTDSILALRRCTEIIEAAGGGILDMGNRSLIRISKPWRLTNNMSVVGNATILPTSDFFSDVVFPTYTTEVPQTYACLAYFNRGTHADDPRNFGYTSLAIAKTITFDGQYNAHAQVGLIMEGISDYDIAAAFNQFEVGGPVAKFYCWVGSISSYIVNCKQYSLKLGPASNAVDLSRLRCYGLDQTPQHHLVIDGDNNGINLAGAVLEKCVSQVLCTGQMGPMAISGVDFEVASSKCIIVDGSGIAGRPAGPVTITGSFLEANQVIVEAINAKVHVQGCRIRKPTASPTDPIALKQSGAAGSITYDDCVFENIANKSQGKVCGTDTTNASVITSNKLPNGDIPLLEGYAIRNYQYANNEAALTSGLSFASTYTDPGTQRMLSSSTWLTGEMRSGNIYKYCGLVLDYLTDNRAIRPYEDNSHSFGSATYRASEFFAVNGTINTSDAREKTEPLNIDDALLDAWGEVNIISFKWLSAISEKGDLARTHFGVIAQQVRDVLSRHGIDGCNYGLLCYDEWEDEIEPLLDKEGKPTGEARVKREAGNRWGIRADQCLWVEAAYMRRELSRLNSK